MCNPAVVTTSGLSGGAIAGIVIAALVLVGIAGFVGFKLYKKKQATAVVYESVNN